MAVRELQREFALRATLRAWRSLVAVGVLGMVMGAACAEDAPSGWSLKAIALDPASLQLFAHQTMPLKVTGDFSDGKSATLLTDIAFESDAPNVATVDEHGVVTAVEAGTATITGRKSDKSATAIVTVVKAELTAIAIDPPSLSLELGDAKALTVKGTYSDGSVGEVPPGITWATAPPGVVTVSEAGVVSAIAIGAANVTATSGLFTATVAVEVTDKALADLSVSPSGPTLAVGESVQLKATGTYGTETRDVTGDATWDSTDPDVATVDVAGNVTAVKVGDTFIRATLSGKAAATHVYVTAGH